MEFKIILIKFDGAGHAFTVHTNPKSSRPTKEGQESKIGFMSIHSNIKKEANRIDTYFRSNYSVDRDSHNMTEATIFLPTEQELLIIKEHMRKYNIPMDRLRYLSTEEFNNVSNY